MLTDEPYTLFVGTGTPQPGPHRIQSLSGNTNPFDPAHIVTPGANVDATLAMTGYARTFTLLDRSAMAAIILPMGRVSGEVVTPAGRTTTQSASGARPSRAIHRSGSPAPAGPASCRPA